MIVACREHLDRIQSYRPVTSSNSRVTWYEKISMIFGVTRELLEVTFPVTRSYSRVTSELLKSYSRVTPELLASYCSSSKPIFCSARPLLSKKSWKDVVKATGEVEPSYSNPEELVCAEMY